MARALLCVSRNSRCSPGCWGFDRMATRGTRGTASLRSSSRLPTSSNESQLRPVMFSSRPGDAVDKAGLNRLAASCEYNRDHIGCVFGRSSCWPATRYDHFNLLSDKLIGQLKQPWSTLGGPVLNNNAVTLRIAELAKTSPEYLMGPAGPPGAPRNPIFRTVDDFWASAG